MLLGDARDYGQTQPRALARRTRHPVKALTDAAKFLARQGLADIGNLQPHGRSRPQANADHRPFSGIAEGVDKYVAEQDQQRFFTAPNACFFIHLLRHRNPSLFRQVRGICKGLRHQCCQAHPLARDGVIRIQSRQGQ